LIVNKFIQNKELLKFSYLFYFLWIYYFLIIIGYFIYYNLLKRGVRIALRSKVNDSLITGLRIVDSILPVGRGQRQLILGDRYTGKTSIYLSLLLHCNYLSLLGSIEGLGTKRIFGIYIGINQNLSKLSKFISFI
jgi:F0F1-type ATP synthase alpha subunit